MQIAARPSEYNDELGGRGTAIPPFAKLPRSLWFVSTYFGREKEISGYTWFDRQRVEFDQNHWILALHTPGSDVLDVPPPAEAMTECPQICQKPCVSTEKEEAFKAPSPSCDPSR